MDDLLKKPDKPEENRRPARRTPNLDSIFAEIDAKPKPQPKTPFLPEIKSEPEKPTSPVEGGETVAESSETEKPVTLPDGLERYLSHAMYRNLVENPNRHGVLVNALERLRSVLYQVSTFIPGHLVQEKMNRPVAGLVRGEILSGSLLFSDVSGFTALSEKLAVYGPEGAERLTIAMNQYFTAMLEIIAWSGGTLIKFAGDATLVYFPEQPRGAQAAAAVRAALRMLRAIQEFANMETPAGPVSLKMKVGVASGSFLAASIGNEKRMEYAVLGDAVAQTMKCEGQASPGQVVVNRATADLLDERFECREVAKDFSVVRAVQEKEIGEYEISPQKRRARGAIPWSASPQALATQMTVALRQLNALVPYLANELVDRLITHSRQRTVESEYRPTTVLFLNFSGAEELLALWGDDGAARLTTLLSGYFNAMQEVITRFGGIISRIDPYSKGTKMLVLFGAPVTHEDDPQRCVSAALAMNAELAGLNERWRNRFGRFLPPDQRGDLIQHRIGITHGITYAGEVGSSSRREYTVMGDDVNLAARLMGAADMGQVLISQRVFEAVSDYFVTSTLHPIKVKGKTKPIPIYQVDGAREDTLLNRIRNRSALVGRQSELEEARCILQQALAGDCSVLTIEGAAGIGKSHLVDILLQPLLAGEARLITHACRAYATDVPYGAWNALLREVAGISSLDVARASADKFQRWTGELGVRPESIPALAELMGIAPGGEERSPTETTSETAQSMHDSLTAMLRQGGHQRRGSELTALQQLSAAEFTSGRFWKSARVDVRQAQQQRLYDAVGDLLERQTANQPLVVLLEDAHWLDSHSRKLMAELDHRMHNLPLAIVLVQRDEVTPADQVGEVLTLSPLDLPDTEALVAHILVSDLAEVIQHQSRGSPMVVEEIARWVKHSLNLDAEELKKILQSSDLLQKIVLSGLEGLPEIQREILRAAAVIGQEFRFGEVQALLPKLVDASSLVSPLRALVRQNYIALLEAGIDARYAFQQSVVRETLYNNLSFERRRSLHGMLAEYLTTHSVRRRETQSRLAALLGGGGDANPAQEAETIARHYSLAEEKVNAAEYYLEAGRLYHQQLAAERAAAAYEAALANLSASPAAEEPSAGRTRLHCLLDLGDLAFAAGDYPLALQRYEQAQAVLPADAGSDEVLNLVARWALTLATQERHAEGVAFLDAALTLHRDQNHPLASLTRAWLTWRQGGDDLAGWLEKAQEAIGDEPCSQLGLLKEMKGEIGAAMQIYQQTTEDHAAALLLVRLGDRFLAQGDADSARANYDKANRLFQSGAGSLAGQALTQYRLAEVCWHQADAGAAASLLKEAVERVNTVAPAIRKEARETLLRASDAMAAGKSQAFPAWQWTHFEDDLRIRLIFKP